MINLDKRQKQTIINLLKADGEQKHKALIKKIERSLKPIKPRSAKNKGMEWQKEVCQFISKITGVEFNQKDDNCDIHSRESGLNGTDVILRGIARAKFPFDIECKNCKNISLPMWISQAENNSPNNDWILFIKSNSLSTKKIIVMSLDTFEKAITKGVAKA